MRESGDALVESLGISPAWRCSMSAAATARLAPKPFDVAKELVRVTKPGGRIVWL